MSTKFYTNVQMRRDHILIRGYEDGLRFEEAVQYKPYCFVPSKKDTKFKTLQGNSVEKMTFGSIGEAKEFINTYKDVSNFPIYGMTEWQYLYLYDKFKGEIEFDMDAINIGLIDIEVEHDDGFPTPERADKLIQSIAIRTRGKNFVFGYNDYAIDQDTKFTKCKDEVELLTKFLELWVEIDLDIITGWNVEGFDIPYLVNRLKKILSPEAAKLLSPFKMITDRINFEGKVQYDIQGITTLDYLVLYKKFSFKTLESYKLDDVAMEELGVGKLDFGDSATLSELYHKDYQRFIDYNIIDNVRVDEIDQKMGLIELIVARAYMAKCKYSDCLGTVKLWDTLIHDFLLSEKNIVVPQYKPQQMPGRLIGGYVKDVIPGVYRWVVGIDVKSEYPHCIMQWNISPETIRNRVHNKFKIQYQPSIDAQDVYPGIFAGEISEFVGEGFTVSANGFRFDNDKPGFLAELMEKLFNDRKKYQALLKDAKKADDKKLQSKYHNRQRALKDTLNSGYGALANQYFRWFNFNMAEAITSSGQFTIRTVANYLNNYFNKMYQTTGEDYIVASDTDSLYVNLGPLVDRVYKNNEPTPDKVTAMLDKFCSEQMMPQIEKCLEALSKSVGAKRNRIEMNRESLADKAIWTAKKHYILNLRDDDGFRLETPKLKIKGIECVRSSTPLVVRDAIKEALFKIMNGTQDDLKNYVNKFRDEFTQMPFEKIAFPRSVAGLKKYASDTAIYSKGTPIQVKGALLYNYLLKKHGIKNMEPIQEGNKIKFSYLREPNMLQTNVIAAPGELPEKFGLQEYLDYDTQFEKSFLDPITGITDIIGWQVGSQKASLEAFF